MDNSKQVQTNTVMYAANENEKECKYNLAHTFFALLSIVMGVLYYEFIFSSIFGEHPAYTISIFAVVFCVFIWAYFFFQKKLIATQTLFFMLCTVAFSLRYVFLQNDYGYIYLLSMFCVHICALLTVLSAAENKDCPLLDNIVSGTFKAIGSPYTKFFSLFGSFSALLHINSGKLQKWGKKNSGNIGLVIAGIVMSIPLVCTVFVLLLSDTFFENFTSGITEFLNSIEIDIYISPLKAFIVIVSALMFFGALYSADTVKSTGTKNSDGSLQAIIGNTVMICLSVIYLLFIIAQIDGFSSMAAGNLPENTTYAQFARSGFFELCVVACINGLVLYAVSKVSYEKEKGKVFRILCKTLCFFTLAIIAVAASKMIFYITAYGFTSKRFCTLWFMLLLAILFSLALKFFKNNTFRLSRISTYVTVLMLLILFYVDWEGLSVLLNNYLGY